MRHAPARVPALGHAQERAMVPTHHAVTLLAAVKAMRRASHRNARVGHRVIVGAKVAQKPIAAHRALAMIVRAVVDMAVNHAVAVPVRQARVAPETHAVATLGIAAAPKVVAILVAVPIVAHHVDAGAIVATTARQAGRADPAVPVAAAGVMPVTLAAQIAGHHREADRLPVLAVATVAAAVAQAARVLAVVIVAAQGVHRQVVAVAAARPALVVIATATAVNREGFQGVLAGVPVVRRLSHAHVVASVNSVWQARLAAT
jgi:hypothetical protein